MVRMIGTESCFPLLLEGSLRCLNNVYCFKLRLPKVGSQNYKIEAAYCTANDSFTFHMHLIMILFLCAETCI